MIAKVLGQSQMPPRTYAEGSIRQMEQCAFSLLRVRYANRLRQALGEPANLRITFDEFASGRKSLLPKQEVHLSKPVSSLDLSIRTANCLEAAKIATVRDLAVKSERELLKYRGMGRKGPVEIKTVLAKMGLYLGMSFEEKNNQ